MTLGQLARKMLGPAFDPVARIYRSYYIDLEELARRITSAGAVGSVLEIGCGDGHLCEAIASSAPGAGVVGIDIAAAPGRLVADANPGIVFRQVTAEEMLDEGARYDLVVLCDVLHHVPVQLRPDLLATAWALTGGGGRLVVKDWVSSRNMATLAAYCSDRFVTRDTPAFFRTRGELADLVTGTTGEAPWSETWIPPHRNNVCIEVARPTP